MSYKCGMLFVLFLMELVTLRVTSEMDYFKGGAIYKKVDFNMVMWYNIYKEKERKCSNE